MPDFDAVANPAPMLKVELAYVGAPQAGQAALQFLRAFEVRDGCTLHEAIGLSGVLEADREIDLSRCKVGIHGKVAGLETILRSGNRVEIYRALQIDPMAARRRRASVQGRSHG